MPNDFKPFPSTLQESLALLYVQSQDLTSKTPTELLSMYNAALNEIKAASHDSTTNWFD